MSLPDKEYKIVVAPRVVKDLKKISPDWIVRKIIRAMEKTIKADPFVGKKLSNVKVGQWRYRVDDYRIRYDIVGDEVHIYRIRHRKDIYK